jgi:hypothetical protein
MLDRLKGKKMYNACATLEINLSHSSCTHASQALYGDVKTHRSSVMPQAQAYVHRFGPGLVLYWFGHAPMELLVADCLNDVVIMGWDIPKEFMLPTGNIFRDGFKGSSLHI